MEDSDKISGYRSNPVFSPEVYRTRVGLSAPPTSLFMTVHPLQGGLPTRLPLSSMTCHVRGHPMSRDHKFRRFLTDRLSHSTRKSALIARLRERQSHARVTTAGVRCRSRVRRKKGSAVSEWTRHNCCFARFSVDPVTRTMMAEFLAMRRIVLTLYTELRMAVRI